MGGSTSSLESIDCAVGIAPSQTPNLGPSSVDELGLATRVAKSNSKESHAMNATLCSLGTAVPKFAIDQEMAAKVAQSLRLTSRWNQALPQLYRKSGVKRRGSVLLTSDPNESQSCQTFFQEVTSDKPCGPTTKERMVAYAQYAGPLLQEACEIALERSEFDGRQVSHLVTVTCTGFASPGIDHWIIQSMGLQSSTQRTHVGFMGCHGMINGLRTARAIALSDPSAVVMVGAVELCSLHQQYTEDPQQLVANALFADGSAAAVVAGADYQVAAGKSAWSIVSSHSVLIGDSNDQMAWLIGDHGFQMRLSPEVPALIEKTLASEVDRWLLTMGIQRDSIGDWAIHPGGPRILDAVESSLGLNAEKVQPSRDVLAEHGNMSSPTVLFILDRIKASTSVATFEDRRYCVLIAFGPGIHAEMILLMQG
jgi:prepilin-type processing-associated H-X9-DG protein